MYNYEKELIKGEKIIYQGKSVVGRGGTKLPFLIIMLIIFIGLFIYLNVFLFELSKGAFFQTLGINIILLLSIVIIIYMIIDHEILKKHRIKNDTFCITDRRVILHDYKTDNTTYGYLDKFNVIHTDYVKDNCGDIRLTYKDEENNLIEMQYAYEETNPEKLILILEQVENVEEVVTILNEQMAKNKSR